jgi:DNA-directed RNA polymerase subunit omega
MPLRAIADKLLIRAESMQFSHRFTRDVRHRPVVGPDLACPPKPSAKAGVRAGVVEWTARAKARPYKFNCIVPAEIRTYQAIRSPVFEIRYARIPLTPERVDVAIAVPIDRQRPAMRDDYIKEAQKVINDPNILINVVSRRVKQLKRGSRPLVESLEKLSPEDIALREIIEGKINHEIAEN